jgi:hypothetical protein
LHPSIAPARGRGRSFTAEVTLCGVRADLAKALRPEAEVVSFGEPKGADDAFLDEALAARLADAACL